MGVMNKLRDNTGVILWILVLAFGGLWVLQDAGTFDALQNINATNIATVNGEAITVEEYQRALDAQLNQYQQQNGEAPPPQMVDQIRDRVFTGLVEQKLQEQEMRRLGIEVSDDEVYELFQGENPHPLMQQLFNDGKGGLDRTLLQSFVADPDNREQIIEIENYLRTVRQAEKLDKLIGATVRVSNQDVLTEYQYRNRKVDARFVALRYATIPDDSVKAQVTDKALRDYYTEHREDFKQKKSFTLSYITLSKNPTQADTSALREDLEQLKARFASATDDSTFLVQNGSETPYTADFVGRGQLDPAVGDAVFADLLPGAIVGPVFGGGQAHLIKVLDVRPASETATRARHILFRFPPGDEAAKTAALQQAETIKRQIEGGASFAEMARTHSTDGSAELGGDLGWFGPGRMVAPFEQAVNAAPIGRVVGPVETQFGLHLVEVTGRSNQEVRIADYALRITPSAETLSNIQERLDDLQYFATENGQFDEEAQRQRLAPKEVQVEAEQQFIPDLGNSRILMTFLETAKQGDVSPVVELNDQFVVALVKEVTPEGYRSFDDVKNQLEPRVRTNIKAKMQLDRMQAAYQGNDLDRLATALGVQVETVTGLAMNTAVVQGLGRDLKFIGTAFGLKQGQTSRVVEGENAVYILQVTQVTEPPAMTDAERDQLRQQLTSQRQGQVRNRWLTTLREKADIQDNRRSFQL
jgi:peptidylprolyl isomerase/peptidyl-prolyl cis-trans isomerase D